MTARAMRFPLIPVGDMPRGEFPKMFCDRGHLEMPEVHARPHFTAMMKMLISLEGPDKDLIARPIGIPTLSTPEESAAARPADARGEDPTRAEILAHYWPVKIDLLQEAFFHRLVFHGPSLDLYQ